MGNTAINIGVVADTRKSEFSRYEWSQNELVVPQEQGNSFPFCHILSYTRKSQKQCDHIKGH